MTNRKTANLHYGSFLQHIMIDGFKDEIRVPKPKSKNTIIDNLANSMPDFKLKYDENDKSLSVAKKKSEGSKTTPIVLKLTDFIPDDVDVKKLTRKLLKTFRDLDKHLDKPKRSK